MESRKILAGDLSIGVLVYGAVADWVVDELDVQDGRVKAGGRSPITGQKFLLHRGVEEFVTVARPDSESAESPAATLNGQGVHT